MRPELFYPSPLGEGRLLILIDGFTTPTKSLEGRTKLAKLDFLLRYPVYLERALALRGSSVTPASSEEKENIETKMIRYRFGPWDPSYFSILGALIGRGLVAPVPTSKGISYRTTDLGRALTMRLAAKQEWREIADRAILIKRHFDRTGTWLKEFIYENFPEVATAEMGATL